MKKIMLFLILMFLSMHLFAQTVTMKWDNNGEIICTLDYDESIDKRYFCYLTENPKDNTHMAAGTLYRIYKMHQLTGHASAAEHENKILDQEIINSGDRRLANVIIPDENKEVLCFIAPWSDSKNSRYVCFAEDGRSEEYDGKFVLSEHERVTALRRNTESRKNHAPVPYYPQSPTYGGIAMDIINGWNSVPSLNDRIRSTLPRRNSYHIGNKSYNCNTYPNPLGDITYCN